jgi:hypothetical protein
LLKEQATVSNQEKIFIGLSTVEGIYENMNIGDGMNLNSSLNFKASVNKQIKEI